MVVVFRFHKLIALVVAKRGPGSLWFRGGWICFLRLRLRSRHPLARCLEESSHRQTSDKHAPEKYRRMSAHERFSVPPELRPIPFANVSRRPFQFIGDQPCVMGDVWVVFLVETLCTLSDGFAHLTDALGRAFLVLGDILMAPFLGLVQDLLCLRLQGFFGFVDFILQIRFASGSLYPRLRVGNWLVHSLIL